MMLCSLTACEMETRVVRDGWGRLRAIADQPGQQRAGAAGESSQIWAVLLKHFSGPNRLADAEAWQKSLEDQLRKVEFWVNDRSGTASLYAGRFSDPSSEKAQDTLDKLRTLQQGAIRPFATVSLVPLTDATPAYSDPRNLKAYRNMYSLQIGYYDAQFPGDRRKAAEEAVDALRKDGVEAYYYHGPHRSLVTVGVFAYEEAFTPQADRLAKQATVDAYSDRIRKLQEQFPYNLGNGVTLIEKRGEEVVGEQASCIVRVF